MGCTFRETHSGNAGRARLLPTVIAAALSRLSHASGICSAAIDGTEVTLAATWE